MRRPIRHKPVDPRVIGYGRDLGTGPTVAEQTAALRAAGARGENIHLDILGNDEWSKLSLALLDSRPGDLFAVTTLGCLARSTFHLAAVLAELEATDVEFLAIREKIDSRTEIGLMFVRTLLGHVERRHTEISQLTKMGLARARKLGRVGGRREVMSSEKLDQARMLIAEGQLSMAKIADRLGVARSTLYNAGLTTARVSHRRKVGRA